MSTWRREALAQLPEFRQLITEADNPMMLWINLHGEFERQYHVLKKTGVLHDDLVKRMYQYAQWSLNTAYRDGKATDASTAVCCAFYEHIILSKRIRDDMHRWITPKTLRDLAGVFTYHFPATEFVEFEKEFLKRSKMPLNQRRS